MSSEAKPAETPPAKKGGGSAIVPIVLTAILAAGGSFAGAKFGGAHAAPADSGHGHRAAKPPGPTVSLDPFLLNTMDAQKKPHAMKVSLAVEFDATAKEDAIKALTPRIRDAALGYFRGLSFEEITDTQHMDKTRSELLERFRNVGAEAANQVLLTDLLVQ